MKKIHIIYVLIFILIKSYPTIGQDKTQLYQHKVDSLQRLLLDHEPKDERKVELLNQYAQWCFYNLQFKEGLIATQDARELYRKIHFKGGEVMYHMTLAAFIGPFSRYRDSEIYTFHVQHARMLSVQLRQEQLFVELNFPETYPPAPSEELIQKLDKVLQYFTKDEDKEIQAVILERLLISYYSLEKFDESKSILEDGISLYKDLDLPYCLFAYYGYKISYLELYGENIQTELVEKALVNSYENCKDENTKYLLNVQLGIFYQSIENFTLAVQYYIKTIPYFEATGNYHMLERIYHQLERLYGTLLLFDKRVEAVEKRLEYITLINNSRRLVYAYDRASFYTRRTKEYIKSRKYLQLGFASAGKEHPDYLQRKEYQLEANILMDSEEYSAAIPFFLKAYDTENSFQRGAGTADALCEAYLKSGDLQNALKYGLMASEGVEEYKTLDNLNLRIRISSKLAEIYKSLGQKSLAYEYLDKYRDLIIEQQSVQDASQVVQAEVRVVLGENDRAIEKLQQEQLIQEQESKNQRLWIFSISGALISAIILALVLYRNNQNKQKANIKLKEQKEEIESTLDKLESTQTQLIQSEKMASLGELTAGIAHEIQNPLNFVNNFSEVSEELVEELKAERQKGKGKRDEGLEEEILGDVIENLQKINHHGQRASGIVKGMLEHSRTGDGVKEPTDINALADEYLRLAYHGMRAKDKSFNADFKTDFDQALPKINVVPQDIGRVLLNLINNAFYAVDKKAKEMTPQPPKGGAKIAQIDFKPLILVTTKWADSPSGAGGSVEIRVSDNGPGIPEKVRDKIFQPFFTTKPTGSGTGLGLSLSYDIVKAHGGLLQVESNLNNGSIFTIQLPK